MPVREEEMEGMEREMVGEARDRLVKVHCTCTAHVKKPVHKYMYM